MADIIENEEVLVTPEPEEEVTVPELPPLFERYTAPDKAETETPGFLEVAKRAAEFTNLATTTLIDNYEASRDASPDPTYNYYEHQDELRKDVPPEHWHRLAAEDSLEDAERVKWRIQDELEGKAKVAEAGYKGTAAMLLAGVASPENVIPMGAAYSWASKGARLETAIKTGALTAGVAASAEAAIVDQKLTKDAEDILYAGTFGFVIGGALGGVLKPGLEDVASDMKQASSKLREELDTRLADDLDSAGAMKNADVDMQVVRTSEVEDDIIDEANSFIADKNIQQQLDDSNTHTAAVRSKILASDYTRLIDNDSNVVKKIAYDLLEGGTGAVKRTSRTAAQFKDMYERRLLSKGLVPLNESYDRWAKDQGFNWMSRNWHAKGRDTFDQAVYHYQAEKALGNMPTDVHPMIKQAGDSWDEMMDHALDVVQKAGVEAFQGIPKRKGYVPLIWNGRKILKVGRRNSISMISKGYRSVGIDDDMADKIAEAVVNRALDKMAGVDANIAGLLQKDQRGALAGQLEALGLDRIEINSFLKRLDERAAQEGPSASKSRTNIDLTLGDGQVKLIDLVDHDLNRIASTYARDISGRAALAKKGITSEGKWRALKNAALKDNARVKNLEKGDDGLGQALDDVRSYFSPFPVAGGINPNARRIQQAATVSSLGLVGAAQLAELGTVVGRLGIKAAAKSMPSVQELFTLAKRTKGGDPILDELRPILGDFDFDHLLYRPDIILDDKVIGSMDTPQWLQVLDKGLGKASTALGYASGMNSVRHFEHQLAAKMMVNKFADLAVNPAKISKQAARLEDIGISGKKLSKIVSSIKKYAEFDEKGTLKKMHLEKWNDEIAEEFAMAINKHTAQVVQRQLAGETSAWMHRTVGSLLSQFRHFPIVAYEKQLLRNLHFHDQAFYTTMLYGFGVSYAIQSIRAGMAGEDMNSPDVVKRTVNYMGMASVAPDALTIAAQLNLAPEALNFRKIGNTGSRADEFDLIDFIPAAGQINKTAKLVGLGGSIVSGEEPTNAEVRAGLLALPMSTTIFGKALFEAMLED